MNTGRNLFVLLACLAYLNIQIVKTEPTFTPILPPSYPLAVRNPYLSAWLPGSQARNLPSASAQFWAGQNLTWSVLVRVDGETYSLFGVPSSPSSTRPASLVSAKYTATHTLFTLAAGTATIQLDFLSPVSPRSYLRQSLPFSYLTIRATSTQGSRIQIHSDIDESWTGQSGNTASNFTSSTRGSIFQLFVNDAAVYSQNERDQALWGEVIYASRTSNTSILTVQSGNRATVRDYFVSHGNLSGLLYPYAAEDVVAFSHDLGVVSAEQSVTFAVGYAREQAINYLGNARTGYYRSAYQDSLSAVQHFLDDLPAAAIESHLLDSSLENAAMAAGGNNYSDILALSTRQAWGAIDVTIPSDTLDKSDILVFMKEISSDGNVNTLDVIYPAFPIFFVMNPEYIRLLLEPVLQYLRTGRWTQPYVIHDIGSSYPNAVGHNRQKAEPQPIEETGNLMILAYAYVLASGNTAWAQDYESLLKSYADYLVTNGLNIPSQLSTDDGAGPLPDQTNLAIKAAVGLNAFGTLFSKQNYTEIGLRYADQLYTQGLATSEGKGHFLLQYGGGGTTYTTAFNLYPDTLLNLQTFPQAAFDMQAAYYPTRRADAGVALDNRVPWSKTDWMLFSGASSPGPNNSTQIMFINDVHQFISNGLNDAPLSDRFFVKGSQAGRSDDFRARPVVGGHFAVLALEANWGKPRYP